MGSQFPQQKHTCEQKTLCAVLLWATTAHQDVRHQIPLRAQQPWQGQLQQRGQHLQQRGQHQREQQNRL